MNLPELDYMYLDETYPDDEPDGRMTLHVAFTDHPDRVHYAVIGYGSDRNAVAHVLRELAAHVERGAGVH